MSFFPTLLDYPILEEWYHKVQTSFKNPDFRLSVSEKTTFDLCKILLSEATFSVTSWCDTLEKSLSHAEDSAQILAEIEVIFSQCQVQFSDLLAQMGEASFAQNFGPAFMRGMESIADATHLDVFRFLSAWSAFNLGDFSHCIEECEKLQIPSGCGQTLLGQAFLEKGEVKKAKQAFHRAIEIDPIDAVAHFFKSKTCLVMDQFDEAWTAIQDCRKLQPLDQEVFFLSAMIVEQTPDISQKQNRAQIIFEHANQLLENGDSNPQIPLTKMMASLWSRDATLFNDALSTLNQRIIESDGKPLTKTDEQLKS